MLLSFSSTVFLDQDVVITIIYNGQFHHTFVLSSNNRRVSAADADCASGRADGGDVNCGCPSRQAKIRGWTAEASLCFDSGEVANTGGGGAADRVSRKAS